MYIESHEKRAAEQRCASAPAVQRYHRVFDEHDLRAKARQVCINNGLHPAVEDDIVETFEPFLYAADVAEQRSGSPLTADEREELGDLRNIAGRAQELLDHRETTGLVPASMARPLRDALNRATGQRTSAPTAEGYADAHRLIDKLTRDLVLARSALNKGSAGVTPERLLSALSYGLDTWASGLAEVARTNFIAYVHRTLDMQLALPCASKDSQDTPAPTGDKSTLADRGSASAALSADKASDPYRIGDQVRVNGESVWDVTQVGALTVTLQHPVTGKVSVFEQTDRALVRVSRRRSGEAQPGPDNADGFWTRQLEAREQSGYVRGQIDTAARLGRAALAGTCTCDCLNCRACTHAKHLRRESPKPSTVTWHTEEVPGGFQAFSRSVGSRCRTAGPIRDTLDEAALDRQHFERLESERSTPNACAAKDPK